MGQDLIFKIVNPVTKYLSQDAIQIKPLVH